MNSRSTCIRVESPIGAEITVAQEGGLIEDVEVGYMKGKRDLRFGTLRSGNLVYDPYTKRVKQIRNPIRKPKHNTKRLVRKIAKPDDGKWFGNKMLQKPKGCRLFLQNPNGIDLSENIGEFRMKLDELVRFNIHFWLLPETNLNRSDYGSKEKLVTAVEAHCELGQIETTNTPGFPINSKQPGGVATVMRGDVMTRYAGSNHDKAGRWIVSTFFGKNAQVKIYTLYRTVQHSTKRAGDSTAWAQQELYFKKLKDGEINPRKRIVKDLIQELEGDIKKKCDLIVCGDFNESLDEKHGLHTRLREIGLMNVLTSKIGEDLPRTYIRGSKCIDHIYVTPKVYDVIDKCGIAPFNYFQKSDHRGIYNKINKIKTH